MKKINILLIIIFLLSGFIKAQEKTTLNVKELDSNIEKYIKNNYSGYKTTAAFKYDVIYEMVIQKAETKSWIIFYQDKKFKSELKQSVKEQLSFQVQSTLSTDDVSSDITKYIKKHYADFKLTEAYIYDVVFVVTIVKDVATETLLFDKGGKFVKRIGAPTTTTQPAKTDTVPAEQATPVKKDTIK